MVTILQSAFRDDPLSNNSTWNMVVLIPEGDGRDFRGVVRVEVLWKTFMGLLNRRFTYDIHFHDIICGFWECCRIGTAAPEAKLLLHITSMRGAVLYKIFMNLKELYGALDRYRCLEILAPYGLFPRAIRLFLHTGYGLPW